MFLFLACSLAKWARKTPPGSLDRSDVECWSIGALWVPQRTVRVFLAAIVRTSYRTHQRSL